MPTTYKCDNCDVTADSLDNWLLVSVIFLHMDPRQPTPPGGRTYDSQATDLLFHETACRDAWCSTAGVSVPPAPIPQT